MALLLSKRIFHFIKILFLVCVLTFYDAYFFLNILYNILTFANNQLLLFSNWKLEFMTYLALYLLIETFWIISQNPKVVVSQIFSAFEIFLIGHPAKLLLIWYWKKFQMFSFNPSSLILDMFWYGSGQMVTVGNINGDSFSLILKRTVLKIKEKITKTLKIIFLCIIF